MTTETQTPVSEPANDTVPVDFSSPFFGSIPLRD